MEVSRIAATTDPNILKARLGEIDRAMAQLASERLFVDKCFQRLLSRNAQTLTAIPVRPLFPNEVLARTGFEDSNPHNNQELQP
jgi:hypothetical protein